MALKAVLDTNVLVRHLTWDPPAQGKRATTFLSCSHELVLADVVIAEAIFVLESLYGRRPAEIALLVRSMLALPSIMVVDLDLILRALQHYESARVDFADAYVGALAELSGWPTVISFDRDIDKMKTVKRVEP